MKDFTYLEKKIKELKKAQKLNNENISDLSDSDSDSDSDISSKISFLKNKHILKKFNKYFINKSQHNNNNYKYKIIIVLILLFILNSSKLKNNNISSFVSNIFNNFLSSNNINQSDESNESNESNKSSGSNFINFFSNFMQKNNNILNEDSNEIHKIKKSNNNIQKIFENNHKITMNHINILSSKLENNDNNFELINNKINEIQKNIYNIDDDMKNLQTNLYSKQFKNNILSKKKNHKPNLFLEPKEFNKNHHKHKSNFYSSSDSSSFSSDSSSESSSSSSCSSKDINLINQNIIKNNNNIKDYIPQSVFLKNYENLEVSDSNNKLTFNFKIGSSYYNHFKLYSIFNQEFFGLIKIKFYLIDDPNYFFIYTYNQNNSIYSSINQFGFIIENNYLNISSLSNVNVLNCDFNKENYINNPILNLNQYENNNSTNTYYEVVCEIDFLPNPDKNIDTNPSNKLDSTLIFNKEGLNADYFSTFNFNILKFKFEVIQTKKPEMQSLKPLNIEISHDSNKSPLIIKNQIKSIFNIGEYDDKEYWNTIMEKTHQINRSIQFVENVTSGYQTVHFK